MVRRNGGLRPLREPPDENLGLPPEYDPARIPRYSDLQHAAIDALDRETTFVILHQDAPERIVDRLERIAGVALAASQIKGAHQAKALRLGLALKLWYWQAGDRLGEWVHLIMPLLQTAMDIEDRELQSQIYYAWSIYLYFSQDRPTAVEAALEAASDYAEESGRDDLKLLARAERFNTHALTMQLHDAQMEADAILVEARRLDFDYVQGRAYLSLARACEHRGLSKEAFLYAQQALTFFVPQNIEALAGDSITTMLGSLIQHNGRQTSYRSLLIDFLRLLSQHTGSPVLQAAACYFRGLEHYGCGDFDRARECMLHARRKYRIAHFRPSFRRCTHSLGLIYAKRGEWRMAEQYLKAAYQACVEAGEENQAAQAYYALAYLPVEQGDLRRARLWLVEALGKAEKLADEAVRKRLSESIRSDILEIDRRLST
jgi:tetratricopeptide (TPR) repeat protein